MYVKTKVETNKGFLFLRVFNIIIQLQMNFFIKIFRNDM